MIEKDSKTGLWKHPQPVSRDSLNNTDEMIDNFVAECERQAAKLEITVDSVSYTHLTLPTIYSV